MRAIRTFTLLVLLQCLAGTAASFAAPLGSSEPAPEAKLLFPDRESGKSPIPELQFSKKPPRISTVLSWNATNGVTVTATIRGRFRKPGHQLLAGPDFQPVKRDRDGVFSLEASILSQQQNYPFAVVDQAGALIREVVIIEVPNFDIFVQTGQKNPRKLFITAGLGVTSLSYTETTIDGTTEFSSVALTPKISATLLMPSPVWSLGFTAFVNALQLKSNLAATARFLGLNFRAGYRIPFVREPWQLTLMAGYYFTTSFVSAPDPGFGYKNAGGPQIYPTVRRAFKNGDFATAYLKYSPIANGVNLLSLTNRELGGGVSYTFAGRRANPWSAYFDVAQMKFTLTDLEFATSTSTITLGASYGF